jgi:two-component system NarL family response regulator
VTDSTRIRVLCADDHRIVREGIGLMINRQADMEVTGAAASGEECVEMFREQQPDVTVIDLQMGEMTGVEAIRTIRAEAPDAKIIVLTMYVGDEDIHQAVSAGASAYLFKNTISDDLIRIIRDVYRSDEPILSPEVEARLSAREGRPQVTPREVEVLELISQGLRDKEIAEITGISEKTVYVHVKNILAKLGVKDRTGAVRAAVTRGIIRMT